MEPPPPRPPRAMPARFTRAAKAEGRRPRAEAATETTRVGRIAVAPHRNVCGKKNNWAGTGGPDLTDKKKLYFLDPTEITNPIGLLYAKKVRSRFPAPQPPRQTAWTPAGPAGG